MIVRANAMVVIRRNKDPQGYELSDLSPCCRAPLVYFNEQVAQFITAHKYEYGYGDRRCIKCNQKVNERTTSEH